MSDIKSLDQSAQEYFYSLPVMIQEEIMQSNVNVSCKEDLERCYKNILGSHCDSNGAMG